MAVQVLSLDDDYYLNFCTKHLARNNPAKSPLWQFPIIDTSPDDNHLSNKVSFIYQSTGTPPSEIGVFGTFDTLHTAIPMQAVNFDRQSTGFYALTVRVPIGEVHRYQFLVDGQPTLDPINPQRTILDDKTEWSRFFTDYCSYPIVFEEWEYAILRRLVDHILPFRNQDTQNFLNRFYDGLDKSAQYATKEGFHRLDASVGEVNYIDKLVARQEIHHLPTYKICLREIDRLLRQRNPFEEPQDMAKVYYTDLYEQMATGSVPGWNYSAYNNPNYFLQVLRRHAVLGAFSHPKYGGNAGGAGWAYLESKYQDSQGDTLFDWRAALERPLGTNPDYTG
jgi:hypothetical protein